MAGCGCKAGAAHPVIPAAPSPGPAGTPVLPPVDLQNPGTPLQDRVVNQGSPPQERTIAVRDDAVLRDVISTGNVSFKI